MSDPASINYEPLKKMDHTTSEALKNSLKGQGIFVTIVLILLIVGITIVFKSANALIVGIILYASYIGSLIRKYKSSIWSEFASTNGWLIDSSTSIFDLVPPSLNYGHSQKFSSILQAQLGSAKADLFTYGCTTGSGKYEQVHNFTVARVGLTKDLSHIILFSKSAHSDVRETIAQDRELKLEGNFGKYFKLLIESGQEISALQILTPDVMQALISYNQSEDVEINANNLYFVSRNDKRDYKDMPVFIQSVIGLSAQIVQNINLSAVPPATPKPVAI
jgi:hypothetical protein